MTLIVHNTLTGKKEEFHPIAPPKVGMYVCGITAYDTCHLGHARAAIVFDVVVRHLRKKGFDVTYVRNYTDVDDKIINRANKEGVSCAEISERYIKEYETDMHSLGVLLPDVAPKATEHIGEMIEMIKRLVDKGLAYNVEGNVFFSVRKFSGYGKLSGKNIEELESGARVEVDEAKADPLDFALWKKAKEGEPKWPSPWGDGRPGWHIECSAMSGKYLGQPFDIHGGGRDLIFPHHENEIAQAEGACGCEFVRYWLHNGFININAEKMSKSLGNIASIKSVVSEHDAEAVRLFIISSHYRSPIDYTRKAMAEADASLARFYETAARFYAVNAKESSEVTDGNDVAEELKDALLNFDRRYDETMDDDFNTAMVVGQVFEFVRLVNRYLDAISASPKPFTGFVRTRFVEIQKGLGKALGVFGSDPMEFSKRQFERGRAASGADAGVIEGLIAGRKAARGRKDFAKADEVRRKLSEMGVEIKDKPDGTTEWKFK